MIYSAEILSNDSLRETGTNLYLCPTAIKQDYKLWKNPIYS